MTKQEFLERCLSTYGTTLDYPFSAFSGAPRSDVINVVLCHQVFLYPSSVRQSVLLSQNGSHPRTPSHTVESKTAVPPVVIRLFWSRRRGSNPRPQRPERCALPAALRLDILSFWKVYYLMQTPTNAFIIADVI